MTMAWSGLGFRCLAWLIFCHVHPVSGMDSSEGRVSVWGFLALRENHIQMQWNEYLAVCALNLILMQARSGRHGKGDRDAAIA